MNNTNQTHLNSADYGPKSLSAAQISSDGIDFVFKSMSETKTKYSTDDGQKLMYIIHGEKEGEEIQILFNSVKLKKAITDNMTLLADKKILLKGFGESVGRTYTIDVL